MGSDSSKENESKRRSAAFESLLVSAKTQGCFHFEQLELSITLEENFAQIAVQTSADLSDNKQPSTITSKRARQLINEFLQTVSTPQKLAGDTSTTIYTVDVQWNKGCSTSNWKFKSSEMPLEAVMEILPKLEPQKQAAIRQSHKNYFNAAHELFNLCQRVVHAENNFEN